MLLGKTSFYFPDNLQSRKLKTISFYLNICLSIRLSHV